MKFNELDSFTRAYINCALWSSTDDDGDPLDAKFDISDVSDSALDSIAADCKAFQEAQATDLSLAYAHDGYQDIFARHRDECEGGKIDALAGHDFWLTRNGHGAGFWDRGLDDVGERLSEAARACGQEDIYVGDDGEVHIS